MSDGAGPGARAESGGGPSRNRGYENPAGSRHLPPPFNLAGESRSYTPWSTIPAKSSSDTLLPGHASLGPEDQLQLQLTRGGGRCIPRGNRLEGG